MEATAGSAGMDQAISRGLSYARTLTWCGARPQSLTSSRRSAFAEAIHEKHPGKLLAYNCSPSFNWKKKLSEQQIARFQEEIGDMGYRFQFVTLAGFHALNLYVRSRPQLRTWHGATPSCSRPSSPPRSTATLQPSTSARSARATSTRSPRSSPAAPPPTALTGSTEEDQFDSPEESCHRPPRLHRERTVREVGFGYRYRGAGVPGSLQERSRPCPTNHKIAVRILGYSSLGKGRTVRRPKR